MCWTKQTVTKHNDSCNMAFGRPSDHANCPRCEELKNGATARKGWNDDKKAQEDRRMESMITHFAPGGKHDQIVAAGGVDTAFEW